MGKIKNKFYLQFLKEGVIQILNIDQINEALNKVSGKYAREGRALICAAYLTGARPSEYLDLIAKNISKDKSYIIVQMKGTKGGLPRPIYLQSKNPLAMELYNFSIGCFPEALLFPNYRNSYVREVNKNGIIKHREEISDKLRYYFKRWFSHLEGGLSPYFLRHNRFSSLATKGIDDNTLMQLKGSRTFQSIQSYKHLSTKSAKDVAKKIV